MEKVKRKYIVTRTVYMQYEMEAYSKKELMDMPRSDYNTFAPVSKVDKRGLNIRRKMN